MAVTTILRWSLGIPTHASPKKRRVDISNFIKSPELELLVHQVSAQALNNSQVGTGLPNADFYLDLLPSDISSQFKENHKQTDGLQTEDSRFVRLLAGQSCNKNEMSKCFLDNIPKVLERQKRDGNHYTGLGSICQERLESYGREQGLFSALVFASAGSTSILTIMEHGFGVTFSEKMAVVKDQALTATIQGLIDSIMSNPYSVELSGCLRVDVSISNVTATIIDIKIDLEPRTFCQEESSDDWMVKQVPGGHEALLCVLLTHHQQKSKDLTAKQATVCAAFDAISPQLASTFDCIAHVAVMRSLAIQHPWEGTVLDVGCGQGVFGGLLALYHKEVDLYGTDMSGAMIKAPQIAQYYHSPIHVGPMEQTLISVPTPDHITCFSVFQYVTPMTFMAALSQMFLKARKSITFDIPEVSTEYAEKLNTVTEVSRPTDHLQSLERIGTPAGWKLAMHRHCLAYTEPNYGIDVYSRYIRYERVD